MNRQERRHGGTQKKSKAWLWITLIILCIAGLWYLNNMKGTGVDYTQYNYTDEQYAAPNASVIIQEYSDFECPYCQQFSPVIRAVRDAYKETVRVEYKQFPLRTIHPLAQGAAEASECAREQNAFWAYHDVVFESAKLDKKSLKLHAEGLGLDMSTWNSCMESGRAKTTISQTILEGQQKGVTGTPSIFLNGEKFSGRTVQDFAAAIQAKQ